ncbi:MAG: hypothetical protein ABIE22_00855 [archaeon]
MGYDEQVAGAALRIKAIDVRPDNPFTWASGFRMPIYNDNRMHLRYPDNRTLITSAFMGAVEANSIPIDFITGTSTAGIAPAAGLAQRLNLPMGIIEGDGDSALLHQFSPARIEKMMYKVGGIDGEKYDLVVSTCPASIIPGVWYANHHNLPLAYVREKVKGHGKEQQIEGIVEKGDHVLLLDFHNKYTYIEEAIKAIRNAGAVDKKVLSEDILDTYETPQIKGKRILHVEDLVSTGGSCIDEIKAWRRNGALVSDCVAIFSYDFPETLNHFAEMGINLHPTLTYAVLLETAVKTEYITQEQQAMLASWSEDPFNWGALHGFPKVEKQKKK